MSGYRTGKEWTGYRTAKELSARIQGCHKSNDEGAEAKALYVPQFDSLEDELPLLGCVRHVLFFLPVLYCSVLYCSMFRFLFFTS